ncbi:putative peroxisomal protein [Lipomyces oligophaga]|uniref:putative peroxisomal protein n=1 Tax=Lipomyces oligophaga TaxID=45792 RepID=UPI0034CDA22A
MVAVGDKFPSGVKFMYVPYLPENSDIKACGIPTPLDADKVFAGKTVVIVSIPGSFTPTCTANHIPPYVENLSALKSKGVDLVICLSANDPFVQSAFGKASGVADEDFIFACDPAAEFSKSIGYTLDLPPMLGTRTARYALIVKDGVITYMKKEDGGDVTVSGYEAVSAAL